LKWEILEISLVGKAAVLNLIRDRAGKPHSTSLDSGSNSIKERLGAIEREIRRQGERQRQFALYVFAFGLGLAGVGVGLAIRHDQPTEARVMMAIGLAAILLACFATALRRD
jgi:hypothetical protein